MSTPTSVANMDDFVSNGHCSVAHELTGIFELGVYADVAGDSKVEKFSVLRDSEGSVSDAPPLPVFGKGSILDQAALPAHNRAFRSILGKLVGSMMASNRPASSLHLGYSLNFVDTPVGNANALHTHKALEYFMAYSGDFKIRAGAGGHASIMLRKGEAILIPPFVQRYFQCAASPEQTHICAEMDVLGEKPCAMLLAGVAGESWVQWAPETVAQARRRGARCTDAGILYDEGASQPSQETVEVVDCSQADLEAMVIRPSDCPVREERAAPGGTMRFEYVEVRPGSEGAWMADPSRGYSVVLLQGPTLRVEGGSEASSLREKEVLVAHVTDSGLRLSLDEDAVEPGLIFAISFTPFAAPSAE